MKKIYNLFGIKSFGEFWLLFTLSAAIIIWVAGEHIDFLSQYHWITLTIASMMSYFILFTFLAILLTNIKKVFNK